MSSPEAALAGSGIFRFARSGKFLEDRLGVNFAAEVPRDTDLARRLAVNQPFPPGTIRLGQIAVRLDGDSGSLRFGDSAGVVSFQGRGGVRSGIGLYDGVSEMIQDLDPDGTALSGIEVAAGDAGRFLALNWGYDIRAAAKGSVALGYGTSVKFGLQGASEGLFAVIRAVSADAPSRDAIQASFEAWKLPRQIESLDDVAPGSWIVAEVDGEFSASLGAQFGYDYSWVRKLSAGSLTGDVGLRLQAAVDATLGFSASGKYLLVVCRESLREEDKVVRLQLHKMAKKGWSFALNAAVSAKGDTGKFLPGQLDEFVAGVFGVHGPQLVEDLKKFREWTDPSRPLPELFAGFVSGLATRRLAAVAGDEIARIEAARNQVASFLSQWDSLGPRVSSFLWSEIRNRKDAIGGLETALRAVAGSDGAALRKLLAGALADVEFFRTPFGRWLDSVTNADLLGALLRAEALQQVRDAASATLAVLDGGALQELIDFAGERLAIDQVRNIVDQAQFARLEPWLRDKLTTFLGRTADFAQLEEIRKTLRFLDQRGGELYQEAVKALNNRYEASLHYAYAKATSKTALVDVSFDFSKDPGLGAFLRTAIQGNLNDLLIHSRPGVTLRQAALTHGVQRQTHVEISLPYFDTTIDQVNQSLASMSVVEDNGRLFVYDLQSEDRIRSGQKCQSLVAVSGRITTGAGQNVRTFAADGRTGDSLAFRYSFRQAAPRMRARQLEERLELLAPMYFRTSFGCSDAPGKASVAEWVSDLDKLADTVHDNGSGNLGPTALLLDVGLPGRVVAGWLNAPAEHDPPEKQARYLEMSRAMQRILRRLIPYCYFSEPERYVKAEFPIAANVLVYQALPVSTKVRLQNGRLELDRDDGIYWEYNDQRPDSQNERFAMIFNENTSTRLAAEMERIRRLLADIPGLQKWAEDYSLANLNTLRGHAWSSTGSNFLVTSLLASEAIVIREARRAGQAIARFRTAAATEPEKALEALADFGSKVTETFHRNLNRLFGGPTLRDLGSLVFLEAARALDPELSGVRPAARLEVTILREQVPAGWERDFLDGKRPDPSLVMVQQPVVEVEA